ncbi:MAG: DUF2201 family putative metallopeptidase [Campylobacterales bacterium]
MVDVFEKIRLEFLFENPFLSVLALSIPTTYSSSKNRLFFTDGKKIEVNKSKLDEYTKDEIKFLYAHSLLHIIFKHAFRKGGRDDKYWNISSDIVINNILKTLKNSGKQPLNEIDDERLEGLVVEEVYDEIYKEDEESSQEEYEDYEGDLQSSDMMEVHEEDLDSLLIQALTLARQSSSLSSAFFSEVDEVERSEIGFEDILKEYLNYSLFEKELTYAKPNRRYIHQGIYLPGSRKPQERVSILVALDSSASISLEEYKMFLGAVFDIVEKFYEKSIKIIPFDSHVLEELVVDIDEGSFEKSFLDIPKSNGGTNFDSVIDYVDRLPFAEERRVMVVLSDGVFSISRAVEIETIFAITIKKNIEKLEKYGRAVWIKV